MVDNINDIVDINADARRVVVNPTGRLTTSKWHSGAAELLVFALCNLIVELPLLIVWFWAHTLLTSLMKAEIASCDNTSTSTVTIVSALLLIAFFLSVIEFIVFGIVAIVAAASFRGGISISDVPGALPVTATLLTAARTAFTFIATIFVAIFYRDCVGENSQFATIGIILITCAWLSLVMNAICSCCVLKKSQRRSEEQYMLCCQRLFCYSCWWGSERDENLERQSFRTVASCLKKLLSDVDDVIVSDMLLGLNLVRSIQISRRHRGHCYYVPKGISMNHIDRQNDIISHDALIDLLHNQQPYLDYRDWSILREFQYYSRYFLAAYGAPLFAYTRPCEVCRLANCCETRTQRFKGPGCCYCSIKAFKIWANIKHDKDIIFASTTSQAGCAVYYVCADHDTQSMMICVRGTLSLPDILVDLSIHEAHLDEYGIPGGVTHSGFLAMASKIIQELNESSYVLEFLETHPTYSVILAGHSMGGAIASLISMIVEHSHDMGCVLVQRRPLRVFSCGPPPVFNHELATSAHAMKNIVSLVSRYDWVPRLSLGNVRRLKAQVIQIFDDIERRQRQEQEMRQRQAAASDAERNRRGERKKSPSRPALSQWDLMRSRKNVFSANYVDNIASDPAFYQQLQDNIEDALLQDNSNFPTGNLYMAGRIFHMIEPKMKRRLCSNLPVLVYSADCEAFNEIILSSRMFSHHFPHNYKALIDRLKIPDADEDENRVFDMNDSSERSSSNLLKVSKSAASPRTQHEVTLQL